MKEQALKFSQEQMVAKERIVNSLKERSEQAGLTNKDTVSVTASEMLDWSQTFGIEVPTGARVFLEHLPGNVDWSADTFKSADVPMLESSLRSFLELVEPNGRLFAGE